MWATSGRQASCRADAAEQQMPEICFSTQMWGNSLRLAQDGLDWVLVSTKGHILHHPELPLLHGAMLGWNQKQVQKIKSIYRSSIFLIRQFSSFV